jgi:hypothetical protein
MTIAAFIHLPLSKFSNQTESVLLFSMCIPCFLLVGCLPSPVSQGEGCSSRFTLTAFQRRQEKSDRVFIMNSCRSHLPTTSAATQLLFEIGKWKLKAG